MQRAASRRPARCIPSESPHIPPYRYTILIRVNLLPPFCAIRLNYRPFVTQVCLFVLAGDTRAAAESKIKAET
jgi:hypothetical protein